MSGLRQTNRKWLAIFVSSVFFGATHGLMQQSIAAAILGLLLGYIAVQTNSILPGMVFHVCYNSLGILLNSWSRTSGAETFHGRGLFEFADGGVAYSWTATIFGGLLAAMLIAWFHRLPLRNGNGQANQHDGIESHSGTTSFSSAIIKT